MQKTLITALLTGMIAVAAYSQADATTTTRAPATAGFGVGNGGVPTGAGSAAAAAASVGNPSGNAFINTSPSGSTLLPNTGSGGGAVRRR
jgi:hypothetical protein